MPNRKVFCIEIYYFKKIFFYANLRQKQCQDAAGPFHLIRACTHICFFPPLLITRSNLECFYTPVKIDFPYHMGRERNKRKSTKCKLNLSSAKDLDVPSFLHPFPISKQPASSMSFANSRSSSVSHFTNILSQQWLASTLSSHTHTFKREFSVGWYSSPSSYSSFFEGQTAFS